MKQVIFVRHAKSSWDYPELTDFERPLNKRGKRDAPFMGKLLLQLGFVPQLIVSSPALRAYFTARIIARQIDYPLEKLNTDERLYEASASDFLKVINELKNGYSSVMLVGHNPGVTIAVNLLSNKSIENIPTAGIAVVKFNLNYWEEVEIRTGNLIALEFPKKYFKKS